MFVTLFALAIGFFLLRHFLTKKQQDRPLPPGPKGYPIIGVSHSESVNVLKSQTLL
jgi:hypothetical protein